MLIATILAVVMLAMHPRRQALIRSLQSRFAAALDRNDAEARQALFKEAVYLHIQPDLLDPPRNDHPPAPFATPAPSAAPTPSVAPTSSASPAP